VWAGVDSAREQEKLEARKMLENAAESHTSGARFVGRLLRADTNYDGATHIALQFTPFYASKRT
jgi:hypothetical protein